MILELIEEALKSGDGDAGVAQPAVEEFKEWSVEELETELRGVKPYAVMT